MTDTPSIVFVTQQLPYPNADSAGVSYLHTLSHELKTAESFFIAPDLGTNRRALAKGGPTKSVLIPVGSDRRPRPLRVIVDRVERMLQPRPPRGFIKELRANDTARRALRDAEVIDIHWPSMAAAVTQIRRLAPRARVLVHLHDVPSQGIQRRLSSTRSFAGKALLRVALAHSRFVEQRVVRHADTVVVFSEKDQRLLRDSAHTVVVFPPLAMSKECVGHPASGAGHPTALFVGPLYRSENVDALDWCIEDIWPLVRREVPTAELTAVGTAPEEVRKRFESTPGITIRGFVNDIESLYAGVDVVVAPLRLGAGVKFKAIDALSRGVPLVATSVGMEGIGDAEYAPLAHDDPAEFARRVVEVLRDPAAAREGSEAARAWARKRYGHKQFRRRVAAIYGRAGSSPEALPTHDGRPAPPPVVSVVIPVINGEQLLPEQLAALAGQRESAEIEVVIADNGSSDRTAEVAMTYRDAFADLRVVDASERRGVNHARNVGLLAARADKVLICDHDDIVRDGWIGALRDALDSADVAGGRAVPFFSGRLKSGEPAAAHSDSALQSVLGYLPYAFGGCIGFRRTAALAVGGFDEAFAGGHDEVDFCWRLQQAGYTLTAAPDAVLDYRQKGGVRATYRQSFHSARTRILLWTRHSGTEALDPISFRAATRNMLNMLAELPRLVSPASRLSAARAMGWNAGTFAGHLSYRVAGRPPEPQLLPRHAIG